VVVTVSRSAVIFGPCAQSGDPSAELVSLPVPSLCPLRFSCMSLRSVALVWIFGRFLFCRPLDPSLVGSSSVCDLFSSCCLFRSYVERATRPRSAPPVAPSWSHLPPLSSLVSSVTVPGQCLPISAIAGCPCSWSAQPGVGS
jgi:hypothetical protein